MSTQTNFTQNPITLIAPNGRKYRAKAMKRVSTDGQDVARQERSNERTARRVHAEIVGTIALEGVSGKDTLTNLEVQQILRELEQPDIDGLIIPAVDRLFRPQSLEDYQIGYTFQNFRKYLWTETDGTIEMWTPEGRDAFIEAGKRAGAELRKIRQRSMDGKQNALVDPERIAKVPDGMTPLNSPAVPYGYRFVPRDRMLGIPAYMVIDPFEAGIVRQCFTWAMLGFTCGAIAGFLNSDGVKTKRAGKVLRKKRPAVAELVVNGKVVRKAKAAVLADEINDGGWTEQTVYQMLTKEHYTGAYTAYPGTEFETRCRCYAIVERDVFEGVRLILEKNKKEATGPDGTAREWLLTGLGWCKFDSHRLMTQCRPRFEDGYYICSHRSKPPVHQICTGPLPFIDKKRLETCVFDSTWDAVTEGDTLVRMISEAYANAPADPLALAEVEKIRETLAGLELDLQRAHRNMTNRFYDENLAGPEFAAAKKAVEQEKFRLAQALTAATPRKAERPPDASILALAARLAATRPETFAERHAWLHGIVTSFTTDGRIVEIECALSPDAFVAAAAGASESVLVVKGCEYSPSGLTPLLKSPIRFSFNVTL